LPSPPLFRSPRVAVDLGALRTQRVDVAVDGAQADAEPFGQIGAAHGVPALAQFIEHPQQARGAIGHPQVAWLKGGPSISAGYGRSAPTPEVVPCTHCAWWLAVRQSRNAHGAGRRAYGNPPATRPPGLLIGPRYQRIRN